MDVTEDGITLHTAERRLSEIIENLQEIFPRVNISPSSYLYQLARAQTLREMTWQDILLDFFYQISPTTASGIWLDAHLLRAGLGRLGPQSAKAMVWATGVPIGARIGTDAVFNTDESIYFSAVRQINVPISFDVVHAAMKDSFPVGYEFTDVNKITSDAAGTTEYSGWSIDTTNKVIDWTDSADPPTVGYTYHVWPTESVTARVEVSADEAGSDGNVPIASISNHSGFTADSVSNRVESAGGTDVESDDSARARLLSEVYVKTSLGDLSQEIEDLEGITSAVGLEVHTVDHADPEDWDTLPEHYMNDTWETLSQDFSPGEGVGILNAVSLSAAKLIESAEPVKISLVSSADVELQYSWLDANRLQGTGFQEVKVPLRYAPIDNTLTYTLELYGSAYTGGTQWEFSYSGTAGDMEMDGVDTGSGLAFKTWYKTNAVKMVVDVETGYSFDDLSEEIDDLMEAGHVFPGVDWAVVQATPTFYTFVIVVDKIQGHSDTDVKDNVSDKIATYLATIKAEDVIYYSKVVSVIMEAAGVKTVRSVTVQKGGTEISNKSNQNDVTIGSDEAPRLSNVVVSIGNV